MTRLYPTFWNTINHNALIPQIKPRMLPLRKHYLFGCFRENTWNLKQHSYEKIANTRFIIAKITTTGYFMNRNIFIIKNETLSLSRTNEAKSFRHFLLHQTFLWGLIGRRETIKKRKSYFLLAKAKPRTFIFSY